jgi:N-acyl-D-aspartate/D-glutamate deacylase
MPTDNDPGSWTLRADTWENPDVVLGGSDAGAHLDRMLGAAYPTRFLADCLRGRQLLSLEQAVHLMTDVPARVFGLRDRGRVEVGAHADLVVFDPATVGAAPVRTVFDLPGASKRLLADPIGVHRVFVNGTETLVDGEPTGAVAGTVLRSGRDTTGPHLSAQDRRSRSA